MPSHKRRLTENEVLEIQQMFEQAAQGRKPSIAQLARHYGVNKPSILKSLNSWKGIKRNAPPKKPLSPKVLSPGIQTPKSIEPFSFAPLGEDNG